ncbi:MAG: hypothetical protein E4H40_02930 [Candidatus Brocadiia bacterium]|nr:MAG: hypothetical protein E4H40_02930 [Candidatus Brocadiia bacterium]
MARKQSKVSRTMLFIWFMLAGTIFLLTPQKWTSNFQFAFARIFQWPLTLGRNISLSGQSHQGNPALLSHKEAQYQNHIANLEQQLLQKNQKIEQLQKIRDRFTSLEGAKLLLAEIITISVDSSNAEIIINRGQNDGLDAKQYVLGNNCVIGVLSDVSTRQAKVKLITDRGFITPVRIPETKTGGIMQGNGDN